MRASQLGPSTTINVYGKVDLGATYSGRDRTYDVIGCWVPTGFGSERAPRKARSCGSPALRECRDALQYMPVASARTANDFLRAGPKETRERYETALERLKHSVRDKLGAGLRHYGAAVS